MIYGKVFMDQAYHRASNHLIIEWHKYKLSISNFPLLEILFFLEQLCEEQWLLYSVK